MQKSRVAVIPCEDYDEEKVYQGLKAGLMCLGGLSALIGRDEKVLMKLNLVRDAVPERAVTTHPAVAAALARIFAEEGYIDVCAGDSPGFGNGQKIMEHLGLAEPFQRYGVKMAAFDQAVRVENPEGIHAKEFMIAKDALEADAIVSVSKMKTHALEHLTGAVKNQYGCIQGGHKAKGHTKYPSAESMARMIVDLDLFLKPRLYIMDGIVAMEGNGPTSGDPVPMGLLLFSADPVALDAVFARLVHADPTLIPTEVAGEQMGLGTWREEEIELVCPSRESAFGTRSGQKDSVLSTGQSGTETHIQNLAFSDSLQERIPAPAAGTEKRMTPAAGTVKEMAPADKNGLNRKEEPEQAHRSEMKKNSGAGCGTEMKEISMQEAVRRYGKPDFKMIRERGKSTGLMGMITGLRIFAPKPHIDPEKCVRCGVCVQSCPVEGKALNFTGGRTAPPVYNYRKCIRCFCCQEMCPHKAIYVR